MDGLDFFMSNTQKVLIAIDADNHQDFFLTYLLFNLRD